MRAAEGVRRTRAAREGGERRGREREEGERDIDLSSSPFSVALFRLTRILKAEDIHASRYYEQTGINQRVMLNEYEKLSLGKRRVKER